MIDQLARQRIADERRTREMITEISKAFAGSVKKDGESTANVDTSKIKWLGIKTEEDPRIPELLSKLGKGLVVIFNAIKGIKIDLPKVYPVVGEVEVSNLELLSKYFTNLEGRIAQLSKAISMVSTQQPYKIELPKMEVSTKELASVIKKLEKSSNQDDLITAIHRVNEGIQALVDRPQFTPQPVTNININALRGFVHTTAVTVTSTLTPLPSYGVLANRRAILIYNNSQTVNLFVGGSDVTANNGFVVPPSSSSPVIDAGVNMLLYGITSSSTVDARVMEISNDNIGT